MQFVVVDHGRTPSTVGPRVVTLVPDAWDDFGYRTTFDLWFTSGDGSVPLYIGKVKIACVGQPTGPSPLQGVAFQALNSRDEPPQWFSVGDLDYYERLQHLGAAIREEILGSLGDIAFSHDAFLVASTQRVTETSLLRGIEPQTVLTQFRRAARGGRVLTGYRFRYTSHQHAPSQAPSFFEFEVVPHSNPPSNIHVVIGRNGVGKTTLLKNIAQASVKPPTIYLPAFGNIDHLPINGGVASERFVNVVSVTFSAFDPFISIPSGGSSGVKHVYIGLGDGNHPDGRKTPFDLGLEFARSAVEIRASGLMKHWFSALHRLSSDPQFSDSAVLELASQLADANADSEYLTNSARQLFSELSSGHAIVLLTITRLVETVAEQSLVLLDEPEAHLHPPLLSAFIRALSDLMTVRNGVAIVATHSPVVLQEVPSSCVWKINRPYAQPQRPRIETFGENVGVLTHEIFGLEVRESGFHAEIEQAVGDLNTYDEVLAHFGGRLGGEAKGLVRILLAEKASNPGRR
ncbi:AAA family ATPase [Streptomyces laurentii]|uniref:AAA family ATPase n=1 Tax=Streptomyces laurentii TaxID=39478 RepID=UPI0034087B56